MDNNGKPIDNMFEERINQIIQQINDLKEFLAVELKEDLSKSDLGQINDDQIRAMLITGRTIVLEGALIESRADFQMIDSVKVLENDIRHSIEDGLELELFKEKVSLLLTDHFLNNTESVGISNQDSFASDFKEIFNIFFISRNPFHFNSNLDRYERFKDIGEKVSFGTPMGEIKLCNIKTASSRYNLPEGYYVAKLEGIESDKTVAFNANEILTVTIEADRDSKNFINPVNTTEYCNPGYEESLSDYNKVTLLEKEERTEIMYRCYVANEKQAYNVLLYEEPHEEYQERLHFYVEDTDGNAIASGHTDSLLIASAEDVMKGIGVYGADIDSITYRLCDSEERKMIHDRSFDMSKLPCMAEFTITFKNLNGDNPINQEVVYCSDNAIATKFAQYRSNEIKRLGQEQNIDFSFSIKNNSEKVIKKRKEKERNEEERVEHYFKRREEIEEQKKREQRKKEEEKAEKEKEKTKEQKKKVKNSIENTTAEILLLKELSDLKSELSQVKTEISNLRKELASKEKNMEAAPKKDTKKRAAR